MSPEDIAEEYKIAHDQLKHLTARHQRIQGEMDREYELAAKRYETARAAYVGQVIEDGDVFMTSVLEDE